jgi:hypothetical protein
MVKHKVGLHYVELVGDGADAGHLGDVLAAGAEEFDGAQFEDAGVGATLDLFGAFWEHVLHEGFGWP